MRKTLWPAFLGILVLGALATLHNAVELPCAIQTPGKVFPQQEWVLVRGRDGQFTATLFDHLQGRVESYEVASFERGDYGHFRLHPGLIIGTAMAAGDTIGQLFSSAVERQLIELRGRLRVEQTALALAQTGEPETVVREARLRLEKARTQAEQQRREVARLQALFNRKLAVLADLEIAQTRLKLDLLRSDIAAAQLETALAGAKEEELDWIRARIAALRENLDALSRHRHAAILRAPVAGRFAGAFSGDTLAVIQDTTAYVLRLPIRWDLRPQVAPGQTVATPIKGRTASGVLARLESMAHSAPDGQQYLTAVAHFANSTTDLIPGLVVPCSISCSPLSLFEYLRRFFTT